MKPSNRREFLQTSAILAASALAPSSLKWDTAKPLLSFSTLGCPDWTFKEIVEFASQHNYDAIELRGIQKQLDLLQCSEFNSPQNIADTIKIMQDHHLRFSDLGSSATLHFADPAERKKNLDEGRRFIDLAVKIKCPFVRVFPNNFPKDQDKNETIDLIVKGLLELGEHAKGSRVAVLVESHGDLVHSNDLEKVMKDAKHPHVGMIWDVANMWTITKEPPADVYAKLHKYILHTHIKDAKLDDGKINYVFLGKGDVPIFDAIDLLANGDYKGYYSFEWEKLWHPEIAAPEQALAYYVDAMKKHFKF
ncbi:MAG: sugar phosphate isomerase/epimerase [Bacteroidetes bacterium]|nr:sugar phosphate isomerase/epimerase [Bacteroidota bacterium]MBS1933315.1 sugar phosphate isomerase/epimerase [Bacteroidota bacterium]